MADRVEFKPSSSSIPYNGGNTKVTASIYGTYPSRSWSFPIEAVNISEWSDITFRGIVFALSGGANPLNVPVPMRGYVEGWTYRPGDGVKGYFPITLSANPYSSLTASAFATSPNKILPNTDQTTQVVGIIYVDPNHDTRNGTFTTSSTTTGWYSIDEVWDGDVYSTSASLKHIAINMQANNTTSSRSVSITPKLGSMTGNTWVVTQPGGKGDINLTVIPENPHTIAKYADGKVPGIDVNMPFVAWNKNFPLGPSTTLTVTPSQSKAGFHLGTSLTTTSSAGAYISASVSTSWAKNLNPYPRTGSLTFKLASGSVSQSVTWTLYQPAFISAPTASTSPVSYSLEANETSLDVVVDYYKGSSGSVVQSIVQTGDTSMFVHETHTITNIDELNDRYNYHLYWANPNNTTESRHKRVIFEIRSGSSLHVTKSQAIIDIVQKGTTPGGTTIVSHTEDWISSLGGTYTARVQYKGYPTWSISNPQTTLSYSSSIYSSVGDTRVIDYFFTVPTNNSEDYRTFPVTFSCASQSLSSTQSLNIWQNGATVTPGNIVVNPATLTIDAHTTTATVDVRFVGYPTWSVKPCTSSLSNTYSTIGTGAGYIDLRYTFTVPDNQSTSSRSWTSTFTATSGSKVVTGSFVLTQNGAVVTPGTITTNLPSYSVEVVGGNVSIEATYTGYPVWTVLPLTSSLPGTQEVIGETPNSITYRYNLTVPANTESSSKSYPVVMTMTSQSQVVTASVNVNQPAYIPGNPMIVIDYENPITIAGSASVTPVKVDYTDALIPASASAVVVSGIDWLTVQGSYTGSVSGSNYTMYFGVRAAANTSPNPRSGSVVFLLRENGQVKASSSLFTVIQEPGGTLPAGPATVTPSRNVINVAPTTTVNAVTVVYTGTREWVINAPQTTNNLTCSVNQTEVGEDTTSVLYGLVFPANTGNTSIQREVYFSLSSGSQTVGATVVVHQQAQSSVTKGITLSEPVQYISNSASSSTVTVYYSGVTNMNQITPPSSSDGSWNATIAGYQFQNGVVTVVYNLNGAANSSPSGKQITFLFTAIGIPESKTLVIYQDGTGEAPDPDYSMIPAWKDTNTPIGGDAWEIVSKNSNGVVLFDEKICKAPDQDYLRINFNRIAESYLQPREFPTSSKNTPVFYFTNTLISDGLSEGYNFRVVDDWSYDDTVNVNTEYILSRPLGGEVADGQYLVYSVLSPNNSSLKVYHNNVSQSTFTALGNNYGDIVYKVNGCGTVDVRDNSNNVLSGWDVVSAKWVIYYYNKYAGWDSFVVKGPVVPSVNIFRNLFLCHRRKSKNYQSNVTTKYKVSTGVLRDDVSPVISEILSSPKIILHDLKNDNLIEVKGSTSSIEKKTYRNQGNKFATYEFELEGEVQEIKR